MISICSYHQNKNNKTIKIIFYGKWTYSIFTKNSLVGRTCTTVVTIDKVKEKSIFYLLSLQVVQHNLQTTIRVGKGKKTNYGTVYLPQ